MSMAITVSYIHNYLYIALCEILKGNKFCIFHGFTQTVKGFSCIKYSSIVNDYMRGA